MSALRRRSLIIAFPGLLVLAACQGKTVSQVASDAGALANAAQTAVDGLVKGGIPVPPEVAVSLAALQAAAAAVGASSNPAASVGTQVVTAAGDILGALAPLAGTVDPLVGIALGAIRVLLPAFAAAFGIPAAVPATAPVQSLVARPRLPSVDLATARRMFAK